MKIDMDPENVIKLPDRKIEPRDGGGFLVPVPISKCRHFNGPFEIDIDGAKCKCLSCGDEVSPMFVLEKLMHQESRWMRTRAAYMDEMKRLAERSKTKCQHCGKITRISRS